MNVPKTVSVTNTQVTTTQFDSLNTNLTDNMNLSDCFTANISQPFEVTTRDN